MLKLVGKLILFVGGWRDESVTQAAPKFVLIAAPHTSNWDLVLMLAIGKKHGLRVSWMGKHTMFERPFGFMLKWLGGIPIDRRSANSVVDQMAEVFARSESLILAVPPEGTRGLAKNWKSGFYQIALAAGVPVVPGYLDYARKVGGFGPPIMMTGDVKKDMDVFRAFYGGMKGRFPDKMGPIRLAAEDAEADPETVGRPGAA